MLGSMSATPTGAQPDPHGPHDPGLRREYAYPAPPLKGPSTGIWRTKLIWLLVLAFAALPLLVITLRLVGSLGGWIMVIYIIYGGLLQFLGGLAVSLSLLMLPRVNSPHERRSGVRPGRALSALLAGCWLTGLVGVAIIPDFGDAPGSEAVLPLAVQLWGRNLAAEITSYGGMLLLGVSALCGIAAVLVCLVRGLRAGAGLAPRDPVSHDPAPHPGAGASRPGSDGLR